MNIARLIMASVSIRKVYRRFAQLSEEEKQQVIDKVKEKLKEKYPEADDSGVPEDSGSPEDDSGVPEGDSGSPDNHVKVVVPVSEQSEAPEGDVVVTPVEDEAPAATEDQTQGDTDAPADIINPDELQWDDSEGDEQSEDEDEKPEDEDKEPEGEEEVTASPEPKEKLPDADMSEETKQIADDMLEDVEEIKSDGKIEPSRVLDLVDSVVNMVTPLVHAGLPESDVEVPDAKYQKVAAQLTEEIIAERVAKSIVGIDKI